MHLFGNCIQGWDVCDDLRDLRSLNKGLTVYRIFQGYHAIVGFYHGWRHQKKEMKRKLSFYAHSTYRLV